MKLVELYASMLMEGVSRLPDGTFRVDLDNDSGQSNEFIRLRDDGTKSVKSFRPDHNTSVNVYYGLEILPPKDYADDSTRAIDVTRNLIQWINDIDKWIDSSLRTDVIYRVRVSNQYLMQLSQLSDDENFKHNIEKCIAYGRTVHYPTEGKRFFDQLLEILSQADKLGVISAIKQQPSTVADRVKYARQIGSEFADGLRALGQDLEDWRLDACDKVVALAVRQIAVIANGRRYTSVIIPKSTSLFNRNLASRIAEKFGAIIIPLDKREKLNKSDDAAHSDHDKVSIDVNQMRRDGQEGRLTYLRGRLNGVDKMRAITNPDLRKYVNLYRRSSINIPDGDILVIDDNVQSGGTFLGIDRLLNHDGIRNIDYYAPLRLYCD